MATPQFNLRIDADLKEEFLAKAREDGSSGGEMIISWIKAYLGKPVLMEVPTQSMQPVNTVSVDERIDERVGKIREELEALLDERLGKLLA